jgi:hypothetical protein
MKGSAVHAVGAGVFSVPLFSFIKKVGWGELWMGCSPAEFPDELEEYGYDPTSHYKAYMLGTMLRGKKINNRFLMDEHGDAPRFDAILNLYQWGEYVVPEGTEQRTETMYDALGEPDKEQILELADWVIERLEQGKRVLVHCQAGLNRSSLVTAVVLMKKFGDTPANAIRHIRQQRSPVCLCNQDFENFLYRLELT